MKRCRLMPKAQTNTPEALEKRELVLVSQTWMVLQHVRETIERDTAAEVMDVVDLNVGGHPA